MLPLSYATPLFIVKSFKRSFFYPNHDYCVAKTDPLRSPQAIKVDLKVKSEAFISGPLTAKSGVLPRARSPSRTLGTSSTVFVHLTVDEVSGRAVVAGVQLGEPLAVDEGRHAAADLVGVGPDHGRVVADGKAEPGD